MGTAGTYPLSTFGTTYCYSLLTFMNNAPGREGPLEGRRHRHEESPEESRAEDGRSPARDGRSRSSLFRRRGRENPSRLSSSTSAADATAPESSAAPDPYSAQRDGVQRQPHFRGHPNAQGIFCTLTILNITEQSSSEKSDWTSNLSKPHSKLSTALNPKGEF